MKKTKRAIWGRENFSTKKREDRKVAKLSLSQGNKGTLLL